VLDLGCGTGRNTLFLAEHFDVTATDISETALDILRKKISSIKIEKNDMKNLCYSDNTFDAIFCISVLFHGTVVEINQSISEIHRVLKPGGYLVATMLSTEDPDVKVGKEIEPMTFIGLDEEEDTPHHYVTEKEIKELFNKFNVKSLKHLKKKVDYKRRKDYSWVFHMITQKT